MPSMPKVRDSSATIGTTRGPNSLSRNNALKARTKAMVVEISRSSVLFNSGSNIDSSGTFKAGILWCRTGNEPPNFSRAAFRYFISAESSGGL